ncbi:hypothetical protein CCM_08058 [Cordyceps militaris CM01]|uniref:Uncharacterized protein n=1 Tax=Cordyceps militaris (strain CM01) TaxID=983644 RepID=G3JPJ5_CORMM|nr:uncharacterized protein CCM_08058 [Cordyceps militaris CM01]EGX89805.1 hypothetical protein CCM_08058 [Cordyceps militaris CM01]
MSAPADEASRTAQEQLRQLTAPHAEYPGRRIPPLHLDVNALYVVLSTQSAGNACHWVLYLHISPRRGWAFHITNLASPHWEYRCDEACDDMAASQTVVAAVKVAADLVPEMHDALRARLGRDARPVVRLEDTPRFGRLTCRTWLLQALYELDNEGYISVLPGYAVHDVAEEAASLAAANQSLLQDKRASLEALRREIDSACSWAALRWLKHNWYRKHRNVLLQLVTTGHGARSAKQAGDKPQAQSRITKLSNQK